MSTVLRAYGTNFDVDAYLQGCTLPVCAVKRRGEPVYPLSQPSGRRNEKSGINVDASTADFDDFSGQLEETIVFLQTNSEQLKRLSKWPGIESLTLDFGIKRRDAAAQCDYFPPELLRLAGALEIGIELSQYSIEDDENSESS